MSARGRPSKIDKCKLIEVLMKYKDSIILDGKIISKCNVIWINIARELENIVTPLSLYSLVSCNRYNIREKLTGCAPVSSSQHIDTNDIVDENRMSYTCRTINDSTISTINESNLPGNSADGVLTFIFTMSKGDFNNLIVTKTYRRREKGRPPSTREYTVLQAGTWQQVFTEKIWQSAKLSCGFNFRRHKLLRNGELGYASGTCKCGSVIKCDIDNTDELITKIKCKFIEGEGRCGKRYLRNPVRAKIANDLQGTCVMKYRVDMAEKLMENNDTIEPPHLFSATTLRVAKYEMKEKNYVDKDPIKSLQIMQLGSFKNIIRNIGLQPFFIYYWTNFQLDVYRTYASGEISCINIDATGSIIKKIKKPDRSKTGHIFLYNCVANSEKNGLFSVSQMLSERHSTNAIQFWLLEWIQSGAPRPREIVCDFSRALLTAAVRAFTTYFTLEQYADACKDDNNTPVCYIRIDVAHFIKKYANFLKDCRPRIKQFYLHVLGQLILCRDIESAEHILKAIFIISQSETDGHTRENMATICEQYKTKMKDLLTKESPEEINTEDVTDNSDRENNEDTEIINYTNKWHHWATNINNAIKILIADNEGDRENAHYMPKLVDYIMKDIKVLPLWSCISRDKFGYGRIPASSASVESDFNIIKNIMLKTESTPMRADEFVTKHVQFISGRLKIAHARTQDHNLSTVDNVRALEENVCEDVNNAVVDININTEIFSKTCPACENGHEPTGAHTCYVCKKNVHALDGCSIPIGEEGYGQQRICVNCQNMNNLPEIIASKETEDWRGLANTQSKGRYLQKDSIRNEFLLQSNIRKIPIMRNGNNISLHPIKIGRQKYSLENTCAFDSIVQLFVAAYFDSDTIRDLIQNEIDLPFFKLINEMVSCGIRKSSYRLRTMILKEIFENTTILYNCILINCEATVGFLCRKLFQKHASLKEMSKCDRGCSERLKVLPTIPVKLETLLENNTTQIEKDITIEGPRSCCQTNCDGLESTTICHIGTYMFLTYFLLGYIWC